MPALPDASLDQLFRTARSYNGFTDAAVGEDDCRAIWELMNGGRPAPTSCPRD